MEVRKILAKAEAWRKKSHRLSLDLRLKSIPEARKFLKERTVTLWSERAELPSLLDAILGRVANEKERINGHPVETCLQWRAELLNDPDLLECRFFRKYYTVLHQDLWPQATVFARLNRERSEKGGTISRDARKILRFLQQEGPTRSDQVRKALRYHTAASGRVFQRAKKELQDQLIILSIRTEDQGQAEILDVWTNRMPKSILTRAEQVSEKEARVKLLAATLNSCVLGSERNASKWFLWDREDLRDALDELVAGRDFLRIDHQKEKWIVPRKLLTLKENR